MTMQLSMDTTNVKTTTTTAAQDFWRAVWVAGGSTVVPRWAADPRPGVGVHEAGVPTHLAGAVGALARDLGVETSAVLLAAHIKVLAVLSGETDVVAGFRTGDGSVVPCLVGTEQSTWRQLVEAVDAARSNVLSHPVDIDALAAETGVPGPTFETVFDSETGFGPADALSGVPDAVVATVSVVDRGEADLSIRLAYRLDAWDAAMAARVVGYHLAALTALTADPRADHARASLVSLAESDLQLNQMAGPARPLPDARFHELFEARVAAGPGRVAVTHAGQVLTYQDVNVRANQVAHALLAGGLNAEDVVGVVTERNLEWLVAVLGILKAGGVYLPIEPHFPPDRITATLSRAECAVVLTEPSSRAHLDQSLTTLPPGIRVTSLPEVLASNGPVHNPGVRVGADQLAYIYFTSGSTGLPKGAMCEHAGMVNHLFAKIDDLGITADSVVAQTAPQCFDISLWQLVAALAVGGSTVIVEQDAILDVARFVQTLKDAGVTTAQLVPSYLDVVVAYLNGSPAALPDLACVSATGEALKLDLVQRWFATVGGVPLVNAYGLTETSDDTNHEVMHATPNGDRVPLGPPVGNVRVYLVDEYLQPVPLGAPGQIAFSGVCVGRGYINDPERTAAVYLADPHHHGSRLYLAGDYGRWGPDNKLYFLGRRDHQVKIDGFRIEIGEIDNALLRLHGVRDGAVVTSPGPGGGQQLVGFYSSAEPIDAETIREHLAQTLPSYMVPRQLRWQPTLPLTANGKIDTKALTALAEELNESSADPVDASGDRLATPTEERLAVAWAPILGRTTDQIRRSDNFYDLGGSSLLAVKLVIALDRVVTLRDVTSHPRLGDLADLIDSRSSAEVGGHTPDEATSPVLQRLREPAGRHSPVLVCLPYAGGNAVNYVPLARALDGEVDWGVFAAELPGHDPAAPTDSFADLETVAHAVTDEIREGGSSSVVLYGHSLGTALALAVARRLEAAGTPARHVFLGAQLLGDTDRRRGSVTEVAARSNTEITAQLSGTGGHPALADLDPARREHVGAAFRHDHSTAQKYLIDLLEHPPATRLATPVTVLVAGDDPSTTGYKERYREWQLLAEQVDLVELVDGGHYFTRNRPERVADVVRRVAESNTVRKN